MTLAQIIELIKALAWPVLIGGVIFYFRKQIGEIFPRIRKAGLNGVEFGDDAEKQSAARPASADLKQLPAPDTKQQDDLLRTPAVAKLDLDMKQELQKMISEKSLTHEQTTDLLINRISLIKLLRHFDGVYHAIFGSQLALLYRLKASPIPKSDAQNYYISAKNSDDEFYANYSYLSWLSYLYKMNLVEDDGENIRLSSIGFDFLYYIFNNSLPIDKRG